MPYPPDIVAKIRKQIVARLMAGTLPREALSKMRAGRGERPNWAVRGDKRLNCAACDELILPTDVEFDFDAPGGRQFRIHFGRAALWDGERKRL